MRPDDRADRIKTLRDLWSEMMQNHTDIQRLWKASGKSGFVMSTGIEAAPPIKESGCDESKCFGCGEDIPTTLTMEMTYISGPTYPWFDMWLGTTNFTYWGTYTLGSSKWHFWKSYDCRQYGDMSIYPGDLSYKYTSYYISCLTCSVRQVRAGELAVFDSESGCLSSGISGFVPRFAETSYSCSPFYSEGASGGGSYSNIITE